MQVRASGIQDLIGLGMLAYGLVSPQVAELKKWRFPIMKMSRRSVTPNMIERFP